MNSGETAPITTSTPIDSGNNVVKVETIVDIDEKSAFSLVCSDISSSVEDNISLVPEVHFQVALDSSDCNRESQPLLGGLDVSYNQFPGKFQLVKGC